MDAAQQLSRGSPYLLVEDVARRLRCSTRTIHELTRTNSIPHRRLPGSRRCLFRTDELEAWESGATLEIRRLPRGGKIVSPLPGRVAGNARPEATLPRAAARDPGAEVEARARDRQRELEHDSGEPIA